GLLTSWIGWREALLLFAGITMLTALCTLPLLPTGHPGSHGGYLSTLRSLPSLMHTFAHLRRSTAAGMLWFFAFNVIWVGLAVRLAAPPYNLGAQTLGLYSLAGVLGLAVTRAAGRFTDRFGSRAVILTGLTAAVLAAIALTTALSRPVWTAVALAVFDAGCFAAQVANQAGIVAIDPARSGALSATYQTLYYAAGAVGTAVTGAIAIEAGWAAVTLSAAGAVAIAALITAIGHRREASAGPAPTRPLGMEHRT
ncbi:MFS transporter, partial [Streptomyces althioticus]